MAFTVDAPFPHRDELGEGPFWDAASSTLVRVDFHRGQVHRLDPSTGEQRTIVLDPPVGFAVPGSTGELVVATGQTVEAVDEDGRRRILTTLDRSVDAHRINDGKCDARGRLFFGTICMDWEPTAGFYRLTGSGAPDRLLSEVIVSNGLGWDSDRSRLYYIDSMTQRIDVFDYDIETGVPSGRRPFVDIPAEDGMPDGMEVDAEGGVWVALFRGGQLRRYTPDGTLSAVVSLPVSCPTSIAFGGPDLRTAFVTSGHRWLDEQQKREQPLAGAVLTFDAGVAGRPAGVFPL